MLRYIFFTFVAMETVGRLGWQICYKNTYKIIEILSKHIYIYCYMLGFLGGMTYAPCSISIVTQQLLLHNSEFVAFP
jgi:hypothetical protein